MSSEILIQYLLDQRLEISISYKHSNTPSTFPGIFLSHQNVTYLNIYVHIFHFCFSLRVRVSFSVCLRLNMPFLIWPEAHYEHSDLCLYCSACIHWCVTLHNQRSNSPCFIIRFLGFVFSCIHYLFPFAFATHSNLYDLDACVDYMTTKIPWCMAIFDSTDTEK